MKKAGWHQRLAEWCYWRRGGLAVIWRDSSNVAEQDRCLYSLTTTISGIFSTCFWQLWATLDEGQLWPGQATLIDPSARMNYMLDLDLGRQIYAI